MLSIFWVGLLQLCDLSGFYSAHGFLLERAVHDSHYWITYAIAKLVMFQNIKNPWTRIPTNVLAEGSSLLNLIILMQKPVSEIFGYPTRYGRKHNVWNNFQESPVFILYVRVFFGLKLLVNITFKEIVLSIMENTTLHSSTYSNKNWVGYISMLHCRVNFPF